MLRRSAWNVSLRLVAALACLLAWGVSALAQDAPPVDPVNPADPAIAVEAEVADLEASQPAETETPSEVPPSPSASEDHKPARRAVFKYVDRVTISGPGAEFTLSSNCLIAVTAEDALVRVFVSPGAGRERSREDDPAPGKITLTDASGQQLAQWDIRPRAASFRYVPDERGPVSVDGIGRAAAAEAVAVLGQQAGESIVRPGDRSRYRVKLQSGGRPLVLEGEQVAGDLWVDWSLSGAAVLEVEGRGWEMPLSFILPETAVGRFGAQLSSEASMRYSSSRAGPEDETKILSSIAAESRGERYGYVRSGELRPIALEVDEAGGEVALDLGSAAGGSASALVRSATLATLGKQHLAGVRDAGLAVWLAQAAVDSDAARTAASAGRQGARAMATLDRLTPRLETPPFLERRELKDGALVRLDVSQSLVASESWIDGPGSGLFSEPTPLMVPDIALALRWRFRDRWRLGLGGRARITRWDSDDPRVSWYMASGGVRAEYMGDRLRLGTEFGYGALGYAMSSSLRQAEGTFAIMTLSGDIELMLTRRTSAGLDFWLPVGLDEGVQASVAAVKLNWYLTDYVALQVGANMSAFGDDDAWGGAIDYSGSGLSIGVTMRW